MVVGSGMYPLLFPVFKIRQPRYARIHDYEEKDVSHYKN
jgi:hypothetical protein